MHPILIVVIQVIAFVGTLYCAFKVGQHHERIQWNKLIDEGIIPAPKK